MTANFDRVAKLYRLVPQLIAKTVDAPCGYGTSILTNVIVHLNDYCGWSREDIADWVDTLALEDNSQLCRGKRYE